MKKKKAPAKPKGGQTGNKNALKHGYYSAQFTISERAALDSIQPNDLTSEIAMARVAASRLLKQYLDGAGDRDRQLATFQALTLANTHLATLMRTQKFLTGEGAGIGELLRQALTEES